MSDYTEFMEYYKKHWEKSLSERTTEMQEEIKTLRAENLENWNRAEILRAENDRLKADLEIIRDWCDRATHRATEALKGGE